MNRRISSLSALLLTAPLLFLTAAWGQMPALSSLPGTGKLSRSDSGKFSFVLAGDNRPAAKSCPQPPTPGKIFSAVKTMDPAPAFVLWTGDTISGKQPEKPKRIHEEYKEFLEIAATGGVPVFNAPGNHELDDKNNVPSADMKAMYKKDMAETYGAFNYGNSRFIALNSENVPERQVNTVDSGDSSNGKSKTKSEAPGSITDKQLALLKKDLDDNKDKAHIFVFMHHPVAPYSAKDGIDAASVKVLEKIFARYSNVSYVVSGHEHMYYNSQGPKDKYVSPPSRKDPSQPPYYLVSGGAGAPLKNDTPGSFFHYLIFNVDGDTITPILVKVDSSDPCEKSK